MIKAAFFDIDGTLLSFKTHRMPESTKRALAAMREKGIKTVISSGRPRYYLTPALRQGFDAYVTMNGQVCFDADGVYRSNPIDDADARVLVEQVRERLYDVLILQLDRGFTNNLTPRVQSAADDAGLTYDEDSIDRALDAPIYQFCAFLDPEDEHLFMDRCENIKTTRWCDAFCDVVPKTGGKSAGVEATLERYGISPDEAIAFGDGENDVSMFQAVGTSVAMGNAWDIVKESATYVTDDVDHDGIMGACRHFGII